MPFRMSIGSSLADCVAEEGIGQGQFGMVTHIAGSTVNFYKVFLLALKHFKVLASDLTVSIN